MGQLKHDGRATQGGFTFPAGTFNFGDLYRLNQWNGICLKTIASGDTVRSADMEISSERIWYVALPAALNPAQGDVLYWTSGAGVKSGATDLQAAAQGSACCKVEETKNAQGYAAVRVLNIGV